jgi:hypothetical protein
VTSPCAPTPHDRAIELATLVVEVTTQSRQIPTIALASAPDDRFGPFAQMFAADLEAIRALPMPWRAKPVSQHLHMVVSSSLAPLVLGGDPDPDIPHSARPVITRVVACLPDSDRSYVFGNVVVCVREWLDSAKIRVVVRTIADALERRPRGICGAELRRLATGRLGEFGATP